MGDHFQTIVDLDATEQDAAQLGAGLLDWLIADGIVSAERTDCVLDGDGYGNAPGPNYAKAVDDPGPVELWSNGLHVATGRTVFDSGQGDAGAATCPLCATEIRLVDDTWCPVDGAWAPFAGKLGAWADGGEGAVECPSCHAALRHRPLELGGRLLRLRAARPHLLELGGAGLRLRTGGAAPPRRTPHHHSPRQALGGRRACAASGPSVPQIRDLLVPLDRPRITRPRPDIPRRRPHQPLVRFAPECAPTSPPYAHT